MHCMQPLASLVAWCAQELERRESAVCAKAAAALSGVHLLQQDLAAAAACVERALCIDPANVQALVNKVPCTAWVFEAGCHLRLHMIPAETSSPVLWILGQPMEVEKGAQDN